MIHVKVTRPDDADGEPGEPLWNVHVDSGWPMPFAVMRDNSLVMRNRPAESDIKPPYLIVITVDAD